MQYNLQTNSNDYEIGGCWSCYFVSSFIYDLYSGNDSERLEQKLITITYTEDFQENFKKGNLYFFSVLNHDFVIINDDENITYIDYYRESGRAGKMVRGKKLEHFRIENVSRSKALNLIKAYLSGNFKYLRFFHNADHEWENSYSNDWNEVKKYPKYLEVQYFKLPITFDPNILDIWTVIKKGQNSIMESFGESKEIEDQLKLKTYLYHLVNLQDGVIKMLLADDLHEQ